MKSRKSRYADEVRRYWQPGALILLVVAGFFLRIWNLGSQGLWLDEGISTIYARSILEHGYPLLPSGRVCWDSFPAYYLMAAFMWIHDDPHTAGRLISVLSGTLAIPGCFLLTRRFSGSATGALIASALVSFSFYVIAWSRQVRFYTFLQLLIVAGIACAYTALDTGRRRYFAGAIAAALLAALTHRTGYLLVMFYLLLLVTHLPLLIRYARPGGWRLYRWFAFGAGAIGISFLLLLWMPSHSNLPDLMMRIIQASGSNYLLPYGAFLYDELGLILPIGLLGTILACWRMPRRALPLALACLAYFLAVGLRWHYMGFRYMLPLFVPIIVFASEPSVYLVKWAAHSPKRWLPVATGAVFLIGSMVYQERLVLWPKARYPLDFTAPQPDWRQAYLRVHEHFLSSGDADGPSTVSAVPLFHDIYLGKTCGSKSYVPVSYTGIPTESAPVDPYVRSEPVPSLEKLLRTRGYLIMDDFSIEHVSNPAIRHWLKRTRPDLAIMDKEGVFVWRLPRRE